MFQVPLMLQPPAAAGFAALHSANAFLPNGFQSLGLSEQKFVKMHVFSKF